MHLPVNAALTLTGRPGTSIEDIPSADSIFHSSHSNKYFSLLLFIRVLQNRTLLSEQAVTMTYGAKHAG